jgi:hypothetical protein
MALTDKPLVEPMLSVRAYRGEYGAYSHAHAQVLVGIRGTLQLEVEVIRRLSTRPASS